MPHLKVSVTALVMALGLPLTAHGQSSQLPEPALSVSAQGSALPDNTPAQGRVKFEFGQSVYTGRHAGELAVYAGVSQGNNLIAFRAGVLDEAETVPCSIGVMYQYVALADAPIRIKPSASVSLARVFWCASKQDVRQGSPSVGGTATLSGGVRMAVFNGRHVAGSLDVMAFVERLNGATDQADRKGRGVMVGIAIHSPRP